ncbi:MAG: hypothetical protein JW712_12660 [Dehalococcoidales bacterium]|nr:hypothetical protein [Dehalococcoidales bacterium]
MNPYEVCESYANTKAMEKLTIQTFTEQQEGEVYLAEFVLIEGDTKALEFLGNVIIAQAQQGEECGFRFGPDTAGKTFFNSNSSHGIYIHRLPCEQPGNVMATPTRIRKKAE